MSYEVQGRQYHQWFGHGTGDGADGGERELGAADIAAMVVAGAAASMSGATRAACEGWLAKGGLEKLQAAVPIWADGSGLEAGRFRSLLVGPGLGGEAAGALQDVGRLVRGARDVGDLQAASARLAGAVEAGGAEWRHGLSYARDAAVYARMNGLAPASGVEPGAGVFRVSAAAPPIDAEVGARSAGFAALVVRAVPYALRAGPWGLAAAAVLGATALYLYRRQSGEQPAGSLPQPLAGPLEARPPRDEIGDEDEDEGSAGRRWERPTGKEQRPEPEGGGTPPPGGTRDLTEFELKKAAKADGYDNVERWKTKELGLDSRSDTVMDGPGNLYSRPHQESGPLQPLNVRLP